MAISRRQKCADSTAEPRNKDLFFLVISVVEVIVVMQDVPPVPPIPMIPLPTSVVALCSHLTITTIVVLPTTLMPGC
jgi:hypothetical protein